MQPRLAALLGLSAMIALTGFGCGKSLTERATESLIENSIENSSGGNVDLDLSGDNVSIKGEDGTNVQYGENVTLPSNFPTNAPVYKDAKLMVVSVNDREASASMTSTDSALTILSWYESQLSAWTKDQSFDTQDYYMRAFSRGDEKITVSVGAADGTSTISLFYQTSAELSTK